VTISGIKCVVFNDHVRMEFPSCHTPGKIYTVEYSSSLEHCDCAAYMYRARCRHVNKAKELFKVA
jgi:hypothetical protein